METSGVKGWDGILERARLWCFGCAKNRWFWRHDTHHVVCPFCGRIEDAADAECARDPAPAAPTRKDYPLFAGCLNYFPDALLAVAHLSKIGNDKHNPGEPLHWSKGKSADHADCLARHLLAHGTIDPETGLSHTVAAAWRALALLQTEIENAKGGAQ